MAITKINTDLNNITALSDKPNQTEGLTAAELKAIFDKSANDIKTYINDTLTVEVDTLDGQNVKKTGDQTIQGVKTFESSPIVPTPISNMQPSTKKYVDDTDSTRKTYVDNLDSANAKLSGDQTITGVKTFSSSPIVPPPATDMQTSTKKYVDDMGTSKTNDLNAHKTSSDHDGRYYTEAEINALLATKTNLTGNHLGTWQGFTPTQTDPGIQAVVDSHTSQLADNVQDYIDRMYRNLSPIKTTNGSISIIGDSISAGYGVTYSKAYASLFTTKVFDMDNSTDYELITNFAELPSGIVRAGSYEFGTRGPVKNSIILHPGSHLTVNRACKYLDFFFYKNVSAGKLEISCNGTLYKTIDCAGATETDACSFPTDTSPLGVGVSGAYTVACVDADVEITGLICLNPSDNTIHINRMALSGTASLDFTDAPTLASIAKIGSFRNSVENLFILAVGTNDIYNAGKAVSAATYKAQIRTIAAYLLNLGYSVLLTVPPKAGATRPEIIEVYEGYRVAIYSLSLELGLYVLDFSLIDFVGNDLYLDDIHPTETGHEKMYELFYKTLAVANQLIRPSSTPVAVPACRVYKSESFSITTGFNAISFDTERFDTDAIHEAGNPTRLICKTAGIYSIMANVEFAFRATGMRGIGIRLNGSTYIAANYIPAVTDNNKTTSITISTCYKLAQGDYIEIMLYQTSGTSLDINASLNYSPEASIVKIG